ncbi:hypothetical protein BCR32DRAFT_290368 [Anaeromyces robustus]|uniref:Protein kinase domain-containing protein n=1 Tax=Anaeromyces robustus TaxID=1754192 RepID=A0A1Y1XKC2_9FUNG|nr:hypothetical protein BCR32DRAFT_290368 [Anaeromyces robustus]|eukprot:ORX85906.1 hypothetical protein BCR32DRAFT_290368 [Anaeromyces robustus]
MAAAAAKCLRFKEPEVDDYVVYKYTESESSGDELNDNAIRGSGSELAEIKEEELDGSEANLISENEIRNSIELLSHDNKKVKEKSIKKSNEELNKKKSNEELNRKKSNEELNKNKSNEELNKNKSNDELNKKKSNEELNKKRSNSNEILNNLNNINNSNNSIKKSSDNIYKSLESMESLEIYNLGDKHIIEGIPQIEIKLNISRDNLLENQKSSKSNSINNINTNFVSLNDNVKNSTGSLASNTMKKNNSNSKLDTLLLRNGSNNSLNRNGSNQSLNRNGSNHSLNRMGSNNSLNQKLNKNGSNRSTQNVIPGQEGNTRSKTKSIADRSMERNLQSQKKMLERKIVREKLRSQLNEQRNKVTSNEVSINIDDLNQNNDTNNINNDQENSSEIKFVAREKPSNSTNIINTDENSDTIVNTNPYAPKKKNKDEDIIPKKDEDINEILKELTETHFLVDNTGINLENILKILGQPEVDTLDNTIGSEYLESATHMKNYEHGAIFKLPSYNNCILKIIPFNPDRNDLEENIENNQVSLKTVLQEVVAMNVLASLHTSGEIADVSNISEENVNQVTLNIEDDVIANEKKILAFARPEGMWICRGSGNQAFNYEFQNYQLNEFSPDQYFLVTLFGNKGEIVTSPSNKFRSLDQIKSILWQVCYSISIAEEYIGFEHRELYPECILVEEVPQEELTYTINDKEIVKDNFGVKATILDYSRSRLEYCGKVYYSDLSSVIYDDPSKKKSLEDLKTVLDSTWYETASIVNRASFADLIQSLSWIIECDKGMTNWLYNNMLEFAVRIEYNINSMKEALNDPFWDITKKNWEMREMRKLTIDYSTNTNADCTIL